MHHSSESDDQQVLPRLTQAIKMSSILAQRTLPEPVVLPLEQLLNVPSSIVTQDYLWPVCSTAPRQRNCRQLTPLSPSRSAYLPLSSRVI